MKKVLIFGLGFQGEKYVDFFLKKSYIVHGVTKSGGNRNNIYGIENVISSNKFLEKDESFFQEYKYVIIAVSPNEQQTKIIEYFVSSGYEGKIIIEKPVTFSLLLLDRLIYDERFYFFIDEVILKSFYRKILNQVNGGMVLQVFEKDKEALIHILEHIFGGFLLFREFPFILNKSRLSIKNSSITRERLFYKISFQKGFQVFFDKGNVSLNDILYCRLRFAKSLDYTIGLDVDDNTLFKMNFKKLREYCNNL